MWSSREAFDDDVCPVREDLLGQMYRANDNGLAQLVETVSGDVRAMLALFCYRRAHLQSLGLAVAASCEERELVRAGGRAGSVLYALAREQRPARVGSPSQRKSITLSTAPLSSFAPLDQEPDLDDEPDAGQAVGSGSAN
jgi:hypothetical protein